METAPHPLHYQLGMMLFAHLLVNVDGAVNDQEEKAIHNLKESEQIPDFLMRAFHNTVKNKTNREIFTQGVELLNQCTEQEKLNALAHLYCLAEADNLMHVKEVRLLLYSLKATKVDFDDVVMTAMMIRERRSKIYY